MDNKPLNDELLRALAYYGAAGGSGGGGGGTGTNVYNDLLGKPVLTSQEYPSGVTVKDTKSIRDYGIAEELQHFFDLKKNQAVVEDENTKLSLKNSTTNNYVELDSDNGVTVKKRVGAVDDGLKINADGSIVFFGEGCYNLLHSLEALSSTKLTFPVNSWSNATQTINGVAYYTNAMSISDIYHNKHIFVEHPEVNIDVANASNILPSKAEREAYSLVTSSGYFYANVATNTITAYSQVKPTSSFTVRVKGAG